MLYQHTVVVLIGMETWLVVVLVGRGGVTGNALCIPGRHKLLALMRLLESCPYLSLVFRVGVERLFSV